MNIENYPEWLVPLRIAEKLKEIGFRMPTTDCYEISYYSDEGRFMTSLDVNFNLLKKESCNAYKGYVAIPNYTQVFDWFRRKNLFAIIDYHGSSSYTFRILIMGTASVVSDNKVYPIYHLCREALVNKLIEKYKNQIKQNE
jgi:hypothetical protein